MSEFLLAIVAGILAAIGIVCVAAGATVVFACLLPASYLAALMLTLWSPQSEAEPAREMDDAESAHSAKDDAHPADGDDYAARDDPYPADHDVVDEAGEAEDLRKEAGELLRLRFANLQQPPETVAVPYSTNTALARRRAATRRRRPNRPVRVPAPRAAVRESDEGETHADRLMAIPSYFFGPVTADLGYVIRMGARNCRLCFSGGLDLARSALKSDLSIFSKVAGIGIFLGVGLGGLIGVTVAAVMGIVNLLAVFTTVLVALSAWGLFRAVDWVRRAVANVRMVCTACGDKVRGYPMYRCPGCTELHEDIRPGPYGVLSRWCRCRTRLPTSLLFGAGHLAAICPACRAGLPDGFGRIPDITIPFFGAVNVGKTQLMHRLVQALQELSAANGATIEFHGDTEERLNRLGHFLVTDGRPTKTRVGVPQGYTLLLTLGSVKRYISLFDAAGELHYSRETLAQLKYLGHSRILIFVADPLAADGVWESIPADCREHLAELKLRSTKQDIHISYEKTRGQMRELGIKAKFARLAFVVSKADVLEDAGLHISSQVRGQAVKDWVSDSDGLDMADEVREAEQGFATAEFFRTAAVMKDGGPRDRSVEILAQWLLWSEGIRLKELESDGP
ncbi:MAG: TRAFAC clade GTPase domain-containing protein [Streptosporangiaceae bacterium]